VSRLIGADVHDRTGTRIGTVREIYVNAATGVPEWITVKTGTMQFQESFVPLRDARFEGDRVTVATDELHVKAAPLIEVDGPLDREVADRLYAHYGLSGGDDDAMTRSEERLKVGKRREPIGKVRLRKYVVTEQKQITVPVQREEVRLEQVPPGEDDDTPAAPTDQPMTLHAERPVVTTETVPVEQVRLTKDTVRETKTVSGTIRREQIDLEES
jgi:uncharacterized protein (TIGR02271 family)